MENTVCTHTERMDHLAPCRASAGGSRERWAHSPASVAGQGSAREAGPEAGPLWERRASGSGHTVRQPPSCATGFRAVALMLVNMRADGRCWLSDHHCIGEVRTLCAK